jgi:hypothetical protein
MKNTSIYNSHRQPCALVSREKQLTLREYFELGRNLVPGMLFYLNHEDGFTESFLVGDCTPFQEPSDNDGGIGWNMSDPRMDMTITEIHIVCENSKPRIN